MAFLSPWFLFAIAAACIPLIIQLLRREKPLIIAFSSLRFFKKTSRILVLFQQIQRWLLLLVRMLILALLGFAFSRPFLQTELSRMTNLTPEATVILLDRSMSMQYGENFARSKEAALQIIDQLEPGDEAAMVTFSDTTGAVIDLTDDFSRLERFVAQLESPGFKKTRYQPPLRLADQILLNTPHLHKRVVLISDFQQQGLNQFGTDWKLSPGVNFDAIVVGDKTVSNLSITDVRSPTSLIREEEGFSILARMRNMGTSPIPSAKITLTIDGEEHDSQQVDLSTRSEAVVKFDTEFTSGAHNGRISVVDDSFPADNHFYFTIDVLPKIKVLLVNGESSKEWYADEGHWFRLALGESRESQFQLELAAPGELDPTEFNDYDVVVLLNIATLTDKQYLGLDAYARSGGSLLLAVGDNVRPQEFNRGFADITPALLHDRYRSFTDDFLVIADVNRRHPLFRSMGGGISNWSAHIQSYWPSEPRSDGEILMRYDNGAAALIETRPGEGRVLLLTTALDTEWNNLPLHSLYLPFVHEMLQYLTSREDKKRFYLVGDPVPLGKSINGNMIVIDPLGNEQSTELVAGKEAFYQAANLPGIYAIELEDRAAWFAVNSLTEESDFTSVEPHEIKDRVVSPVTKPEPSRQILNARMNLQLERSQRIWWWLLLLVFLASIAESVLSNRTHR